MSSDSEITSPIKMTSYSSDSDEERYFFAIFCRVTSLILIYRNIKLYNDNPNLPVYQYTKCRYNVQTIVEILLNSKLSLSKIATTRPVSIQDNATFVVDLSKLQKKEDIRADDLGSWRCNGKRFMKCEVDKKGKVIGLISQSRRHFGTQYTVVRRYYEHATSRDFKKTIAEIIGESDNLEHLFRIHLL